MKKSKLRNSDCNFSNIRFDPENLKKLVFEKAKIESAIKRGILNIENNELMYFNLVF